MSKLAALLRRVGRSEPAPMGFATMAGRAKNPEIILGVRIEKLDLDAVKAAAKAGAKLILLNDGDLEKGAAKIQAVTSATDLPCGLSVAKPVTGVAATARDAGLDFLHIEDDNAPATILLDEEIGYLFSVAEDLSDTALRVLESTPFDALVVDGITQPLSIRQQLQLRRISAFAHKPLFLQFSDGLTSEELECLRDSGVGAMLLDGPDAAKRLSAARATIDAMRPRRRRRNEREASPTLPSAGRGGEDDDDEDD
ncbi:MAG TPA: hypothetical protein VK821_02935 [Dehalococcoidia bacterium]|nr:hypothetical protein [Dehalococcoidia bacterium]